MTKNIYILFIAITLLNCTSEKKTATMKVSGQIKGLKKGMLYLQKMQDTILVSVDSLKLLGTDTFMLFDNIETPEIYYLTFDGNSTKKRMMFFGEKGEITITNTLDKFGINPIIKGSKNQEIYENYKKYDHKFATKHLTYIQEDFNARKVGNIEKVKQCEF